MAEDDPYSEFRTAPPPDADPYSEFRTEPENPASRRGILSRVVGGFQTLPRDMVDQFMEGVHTTLDPSGRISGEGGKPAGFEDLQPRMEKSLLDGGATPEYAKAEAARQMNNMERNQVMANLIMGPLQAVFGPMINAPIRSFISRPAEEEFGLPKEITETILNTAIALRGLSRMTVFQDGKIKTQPIGDEPTGADFKNAAKSISREPTVIEGDYTVVDDGAPRPPQKRLGGPVKEADVESNLRRAWDEDGIHPAEAAHDVQTDPFLRDQLTRKPSEGDASWLHEPVAPRPAHGDASWLTDPVKNQPIEAWHGSPHDFVAFDMSRIGTGEGAQAFGWGLYFAEGRGVAQSYAEHLSQQKSLRFASLTEQENADLGSRFQGSRWADASEENIRHAAKNLADQTKLDMEQALEEARFLDAEGGNAKAADMYKERAVEYRRRLSALNRLIESDNFAFSKPEGNMYRVRINANREHMLDWDRPLSEQNESVKTALQKVIKNEVDWSQTGGDFVRSLGSDPGGLNSKLLNEAGIPGIKYFDQGSRETGSKAAGEDVAIRLLDGANDNRAKAIAEGERRIASGQEAADTPLHQAVELLKSDWTDPRTRNFVIFDDQLIDITHKNGTEIVRQVDLGNGAPPRSANVSPDALPRTMYPQAVAAANGQAPAGGGQPPGAPPGTPPATTGGGRPPAIPTPPGMPTTPTLPPRAPYFTYDDRNAFVKAFSSVIEGWQKTFQPDLVSDRALQADPRFAEYKSRSQNLKDQIVHNQEDSYQYWRTQSEADRLAYLRGFETGNVPAPLRARADVHKQIMQKAHQMEVQGGSQADYFENYFPHLFQSPQQAAVWMKGKTAQVGPTWFQKERTFSTIREAMDAGLRLVSTNPEYLITHRLFSTSDMLERMDLIHDLKKMGLAETVAQARADRAARIDIAQRLGFVIDVTTVGRDLAAEGWEIINAPAGTGRGLATAGRLGDDRQWFIAPDVRPLWQNAMAAKGLWGNEGAAGNVFRGWMSFKNAWVPIKLALSAFHPLHVAHINMTGHIVRALSEASRGEYGDALRSMGDVVYDPIAAAIPKLTHEGRFAREAWLVPEDARTPLQRAVVKTMEEGGLVANISEQLRIDSQRKLEEAWDNHQWFRMAPQLVRETLRLIGAPVFEHWIPNLKVGAYLREAADFLHKNPNIANDDIQRGVALRTIGKSVENRYGEMFYGNLFWNRTLKDIGIGSFISLGWNAGFIREFGGALVGPMARGVRSITRGPTQTEETIYHAQSKFSYAFAYMAGAMLINGIITYASTGDDPDGMDWAFPRTGRNNPDGSPHRLTNMFYSREVPMVEKHIQSSGSVVGGIADTLYGKLVVGPIVELARNKDHYGNEIWSEGNPLYKRGAQAGQYLFGNQMMPMSITGAQQAMKTGGGWDEAALAMIGFGPAPSYANMTATQNLISHLFQRFVAPEARPQEMGIKAKERGDIRSTLLMAQQRGDDGAVTDASQRWFKAGGSRQGLTNILMHIPPDVSMFRALPEPAQNQVMTSAPPEEASKYKPYLKSDTASHVADLQIEAMTANRAGDDAGVQRVTGQIQAILSDAVHSGRITNITEFQKSVQQNMMFRLSPQSAAQKTDAPRQRRLMSQP